MNTDWLKSFKDLADRIDALSIRERGIIFGGILAILFVVAFNMIFAPMRAEQASLEKAITAKFEQTGKLQAEAKRMSEELVQDPNAANRTRIADLKNQLAATEAEVAAVTRGLVSPKDMARMVEQILATNRAVQVVRVENLPSLSLLDPPADPAKPPPAGASPAPPPAPAAGIGLYRHGMRIQVKGNYLDIIRVLRSMEGLPWKVFWGEVSVKTEKYPQSHATVVIYTLNQDRAWIGI
jgi:MSHA biogenesis protein MshJ